jgi:hypothetical protein
MEVRESRAKNDLLPRGKITVFAGEEDVLVLKRRRRFA